MSFHRCSGSVTGRHGLSDVHGCCPWCGVKYEPAMVVPRFDGPSKLTDAYGSHYDPDYGSMGPAEIRTRLRMGLEA